jgi:peptide/nickel transport system ATP-binding protein
VTILQTRGLVVRYDRGARALTAVDGVDLTVPRGGTLGIVGESGCGKSTLARSLVGLAPATGGQIIFDGQDVTSLKERQARAYRRHVQMVFQDPRSSLNPRMTVGKVMTEALGMRRPRLGSRAEQHDECVRLLSKVGLPADAMTRYPHQFSGGQRQRIAIARALAVGPSLLVNDEVTSALDVSIQATILNLLKDLQRELGLSYIFISHDLSVVRIMSDVIAVMYLGRIVEIAEPDELFLQPSHPYTRALLASAPTLAGARRKAPVAGELPDPRNPPSGCRFHPRCPVGPLTRPERTICRDVDPAAGVAEREHASACHFSAPRPAGTFSAPPAAADTELGGRAISELTPPKSS